MGHRTRLALNGEPEQLDCDHVNASGGRKFYSPQSMRAHVESDGSKWVDIMVNSRAHVYFFTQAVVDACNNHGISGVEFYPVELEYSKNGNLPLEGAPKLFWGRVTGMMEAIRVEVGPSPIDIEYRMAENTWSGDDIFLMSNQKANITFCTGKFIKAAAASKLAGFLFRPLPENNIHRINRVTAPVPYLK